MLKFYTLVVALVLGAAANAMPSFSTPGVSVKNGVVTGSARVSITTTQYAKVAVALDFHARWKFADGETVVLGEDEYGNLITETEEVSSWTCRNFYTTTPTMIILSVVGYTPAAPPAWAITMTERIGGTMEYWWIARSEAHSDGVWYDGPKVATKTFIYTAQ